MITKTYTFWGAFAKAALTFILLGFVSIFLARTVYGDIDWIILWIGIFIFGYVMYESRRKEKEIQGRPEGFVSLAQEYGYEYNTKPDFMLLSQNLQELGERDTTLCNSLTGNGWQYADYSYAVYRRTKHGEYKAENIYYSVLELDLPRALPNLLFDSPKTHRRQFKHTFDSSQVHKLEGNFDKHFITYFPKFYSIDALSIISPEVMQAMIDADEYDIEISGNKLFFYRPLMPVEYIPEMVRKGEAIKQKLLNNIVTYKDERLDGGDGRKGVSMYGHQLRLNPYRALPGLIGGIVLTVVGVIYGLKVGAPVINQASVYGLLITGYSGFSIWRVWYKNRLLDERYRKIHNNKPEKVEKAV
ncbi:hypothetical protein CYG49_04045 [Candidatus Saccharibacteria bacterium]|nr:MAG: hypothetical protein CYG49_04045 [Candidatus Saccharibacteria bacterium]